MKFDRQARGYNRIGGTDAVVDSDKPGHFPHPGAGLGKRTPNSPKGFSPDYRPTIQTSRKYHIVEHMICILRIFQIPAMSA